MDDDAKIFQPNHHQGFDFIFDRMANKEKIRFYVGDTDPASSNSLLDYSMWFPGPHIVPSKRTAMASTGGTPYTYGYNGQNFQQLGQGTTPPAPADKCPWCHDTYSDKNPRLTVSHMQVTASVFGSYIGTNELDSPCRRCYELGKELATDTESTRDNLRLEVATLKNLLYLAAKYTQVCNEGGDWDITDKSPEFSLDLLKRIREAMGLEDNHDFTKR